MAWNKGKRVSGRIEVQHGTSYKNATKLGSNAEIELKNQQTISGQTSGQVTFNSALVGHKLKFVNKTADYTVTAAETGCIFTNVGDANAIAYTLPAKAAGLQYWFVSCVDQNMSVVADAVNTVITFNNATTADSVIFSTASEKIGAMLYAFSDGTYWYLINMSPNTATVVTS